MRHAFLARCFIVLSFAVAAVTAQAQTTMPDETELDWAWNAYLDGNHGEALDILRQAAEAGDAPSQAMMGWAYETGQGVPEDTKESIFWYQEAALQDYGDAYSSLGLLYYYGRTDLPQNYDLAIAYYNAGIELNDPESFSFLAYMYQEGHGVPQDYARAAELYLGSADLGDGYGAAQYAYLLREGLGLPRNEALARQYYERAIELDYEWGYVDLAHLLHRGIGGPVDLERALNLYLEGLEMGLAYSGIGAGYLILENPDEYPDPVVGLSLCFWAVENADPGDVAEYRDDCDYWAQDFTPTEISRANRMAANY